MKDILFEKHFEIIDENVIAGDLEIANSLKKVSDAAAACVNTTKEISKGFAEWVYSNYYRQTDEGWENDFDIEVMLNTEELLEKYLETLNQK